MNARDTVLLEYECMPDGTSQSGERCPACGGGDSQERSLSVTKEDGQLKWYCHRASCGFKGTDRTTSGTYGLSSRSVSVRRAVGRDLHRTAQAVPAEVQEVLSSRYSLTESHIARWGLGWDEQEQRLVIPVIGSNGEIKGAVLRSLNKQVIKKSISHTEEDAIAWYINERPTHKGVIVVEDQFSAIRFSDYSTSVALLGTNLNVARMQEIVGGHLAPVYLALDADAWRRTIEHVVKYRGICKMLPLKLPKDGKDMTNEEMEQFLKENTS